MYACGSSFAQARRDANATFNAFNGNNNAGAKNNEEFFGQLCGHIERKIL